MTRAKINAAVERHRQAFISRDADALAACHAEDGSFESPAAGKVHGRDRIRAIYQYWLKAFPDMEFTWDKALIDGDRVSLFWEFQGTLQGEFFGHTKPGARVAFSGAGEYHLSPQGIVRAKHIFDFTGALVSAGVLKVKPRDPQ